MRKMLFTTVTVTALLVGGPLSCNKPRINTLPVVETRDSMEDTEKLKAVPKKVEDAKTDTRGIKPPTDEELKLEAPPEIKLKLIPEQSKPVPLKPIWQFGPKIEPPPKIKLEIPDMKPPERHPVRIKHIGTGKKPQPADTAEFVPLKTALKAQKHKF